MRQRRPFPFTRRQRGFGLFDGVVSLALLAFGMLALSRFEAEIGSAANEATHRSNAAALADELLTSLLTDPTNPNCYTLPPVTPCGNPTARAQTDAWKVRAMARLPNASASAPTSAINPATGRATVTLWWYHKNLAEARTHQVQSDIR